MINNEWRVLSYMKKAISSQESISSEAIREEVARRIAKWPVPFEVKVYNELLKYLAIYKTYSPLQAYFSQNVNLFLTQLEHPGIAPELPNSALLFELRNPITKFKPSMNDNNQMSLSTEKDSITNFPFLDSKQINSTPSWNKKPISKTLESLLKDNLSNCSKTVDPAELSSNLTTLKKSYTNHLGKSAFLHTKAQAKAKAKAKVSFIDEVSDHSFSSEVLVESYKKYNLNNLHAPSFIRSPTSQCCTIC